MIIFFTKFYIMNNDQDELCPTIKSAYLHEETIQMV